MKSKVSAIAILLTTFFMLSLTKDPVKQVVFFGDSITQMGVERGGYISLIGNMMDSAGLSSGYKLSGAGIGGNKIYDLYLRMDDDVLAKSPDVVVIWVGVNDVWHKFSSGTGTDADKFAKFYQAIISKLQARHCRIILCTPATIGEKTDCSNQQDGDLNAYSQIIRDLAVKNGCQLCDFRQIFLQYNLLHNPSNQYSGILTTDGVHLNPAGNRLVAGALFKLISQ